MNSEDASWQSRIFVSFCLLPRVFGVVLPCLEFFYSILMVLMFSAATYSQVTVTSSFVACTNAEISASCALSTKEGDKIYLINPEIRPMWPICGLHPANFQEYHLIVTFRIFRSLFWTLIECNFLQLPTDFCCLATPLKVVSRQRFEFFAGFAPCFRGFAPCLRACFGRKKIILYYVVTKKGENTLKTNLHKNSGSGFNLANSQNSGEIWLQVITSRRHILNHIGSPSGVYFMGLLGSPK